MKIAEKLQLIQQLSGLTQNELAQEIGVSFAAYNRWVNSKAVPRKSKQDKINVLYGKLTGQKHPSEDLKEAKFFILQAKKRKEKKSLKKILINKDLLESFVLAITYNSNRIEGSTLSEVETAAVLFDNISFSNKTLTEHLEAKNHQTALRYLFRYVDERNTLDEKFILKMHEILMSGILDDAGMYRNHGVRIVGSQVVTANYAKIPALMKSLMNAVKKKKGNLARIAETHSRFEQIHPFSDGNGRVGRLLMIAMLLEQSYPPAIISQKRKRKYYSVLQKAQLKGEYGPLEEFLFDAILVGYKLLER